MKASRGEKNNNTVSPVTHKRKHLCVRTLLFKNVYPRSLNDVRTSSSHAVRLLLKSRREQFSLPDSHELMDFHLPGGKTCFGSAFFCLHAHISSYWRITFLQMYSLLCKLAQLQFPFVFSSPDLINGNYLQAFVIEIKKRGLGMKMRLDRNIYF